MVQPFYSVLHIEFKNVKIQGFPVKIISGQSRNEILLK